LRILKRKIKHKNKIKNKIMSCKKSFHSARIKALIILIAIIHILGSNSFPKTQEHKDENFTIIITANLQGLYSTEIEDQEKEDTIITLAQSIVSESKEDPFDLYVDLGNSLYPGALSKYSYGSAIFDFFDFTNCKATVLSSRDLNIGLSNIELSSNDRKTKILSSNMLREQSPLFMPYFIHDFNGKKIAFIGITSQDSVLDDASKKILDVDLLDYNEAVKSSIQRAKEEGCKNIILLSSLNLRQNTELIKNFPEIDLIFTGNEPGGKFFSVPISRVDIDTGGTILVLNKNKGFYRLELNLTEKPLIESLKFYESSYKKIHSNSYNNFISRISIWKSKFSEEENKIITETSKPISISDENAAQMLRHRYRTEIAIIEKNSILPKIVEGTIYSRTILGIVNNDYPIFTYRLSGADIKKIIESDSDFVISGIKNNKIQGYEISDPKFYSVCSTQFVYDKVTRILRKDIKYTNRWNTITEEITDDLKKDKSFIKENYDYLDERFRLAIDINLSNFYDKSEVSKGDKISTPPGKPSTTYTRWGMEDTINIKFYNNHHEFLFTPYIYFIKKDEQYLQNLLRGTFLYTYNANDYVKPYHKSVGETVVKEVDGRPILVRETIGASLFWKTLNGKIGIGFEKQIQEEEGPVVYGFETIMDAKFNITNSLAYIFKLDTFISSAQDQSNLQMRTEIANSLSLQINSILGISLKHKWFKLYSREIEDSYKYTQTLISLDLKTDFKFF